MVTLTLGTKRVFRNLARSGLPDGKALRLVLAGRTKDGGPRVGIRLGESRGTDRPVLHEGEAVAWVSAGVMEAYAGGVLSLEKEWPKGAGISHRVGRCGKKDPLA